MREPANVNLGNTECYLIVILIFHAEFKAPEPDLNVDSVPT